MKAPIIAGNWKMHKTIPEAVRFVKELEARLPPNSNPYLAVPFTAIRACATHAVQCRIGAQNMHDALEGPFTGEISAPMLKDAGAQFVLIGHSERRHLCGEDDALIRRKLARALEEKLEPILCVGERLAEREAQATDRIVLGQLETAFEGIDFPPCLKIAYEPVWAIGTGKNATAEQAQEVHAYIRKWLSKRWPGHCFDLLYGGSVRPDNAAILLKQPDINGVLVGGASLQVDSFLSIIEGASG